MKEILDKEEKIWRIQKKKNSKEKMIEGNKKKKGM